MVLLCVYHGVPVDICSLKSFNLYEIYTWLVLVGCTLLYRWTGTFPSRTYRRPAKTLQCHGCWAQNGTVYNDLCVFYMYSILWLVFYSVNKSLLHVSCFLDQVQGSQNLTRFINIKFSCLVWDTHMYARREGLSPVIAVLILKLYSIC